MRLKAKVEWLSPRSSHRWVHPQPKTFEKLDLPSDMQDRATETKKKEDMVIWDRDPDELSRLRLQEK
ncbi:hypothetical protein BH09VER1_BH09VER1_17790 [soil metagenome]